MYWYDWAVIAIAVFFVIRGWRRGAMREAIDAALLILGSVVVFRMSPPIGTIVAGMANIPYEVGRVVAAVIIFVTLLVATWLVGRVVASAMHVVPGATAFNRLGGAGIGLVVAAVVVVLGTTLLSAAPMPDGVRAGINETVEASVVGSYVTESDGTVQRVVASASGEQVVGAVVAVRDAVGDRLMAGTIPVPFPSVDGASLAPSQATAQSVFDDLNRSRIGAGLDPLGWSPDLAIVAVSRATSVYRSGVLALDNDLSSALVAAGVPGTIHADMVVIAASSDGVVEAITTASEYEARLLDPDYRKGGVGVVDGPYGLIAVQVLSG